MELKTEKSTVLQSTLSTIGAGAERPSASYHSRFHGSERPRTDSNARRHEIKAALAERVEVNTRFKTLPSAVLAIHVKQCTRVRLDYDNLFAKNDDVSIYLRMHVGSEVTCTTSERSNAKDVSTTLVYDCIRNILLPEISCVKDDPSNNIRLELVAFKTTDVHMVVGKKDIHLYEIIKRLQVSETYELRNDHSFVVGRLEIEFVFAYGVFGYGYSSQLEDYRDDPESRIYHSLFLRADPPENRKVAQADIINCVPVQHPTFINFTAHAEIGMAKEFAHDEQLFKLVPHRMEPICLISKMKKRLYHLQMEYSLLETRHGRLQYLRHLLMGHDSYRTSLSSQTVRGSKDDMSDVMSSRHQDDEDEEQLAKEAAAIAALYRRDVSNQLLNSPTPESEHEVKPLTPRKMSLCRRIQLWWRQRFASSTDFSLPDVFIEPATPPSSEGSDDEILPPTDADLD